MGGWVVWFGFVGGSLVCFRDGGFGGGLMVGGLRVGEGGGGGYSLFPGITYLE